MLIDLGADFRLTEEADYTKWYGLPFKHPALHKKALYCLPEINRESIPGVDIIANPGCYPTSIALGLMPALKEKLCDVSNGIILDSKSGVTALAAAFRRTRIFRTPTRPLRPTRLPATAIRRKSNRRCRFSTAKK